MGMRQRSNRVLSNNSSCSLPLKLSIKAFCTGLPRCDVMPALPFPVRPFQNCCRVSSVPISDMRRSSWVGDHNDVVKLPCHPNAGDRRERLKALSGAGEISVVFETISATLSRVIAFDRLGFGHTNQPRSRTWTPTVQGAHSARYPASDRGRH